MTQFTCTKCNETKSAPIGSCGTGYATNANNDKLCYTCCAIVDQEQMREYGSIYLYLTHDSFKEQNVTWYANWRDGKVSNWPGTFTISCRVKRGRHNIARWRYDCWFKFENTQWHGVQYGDNTQLVHCKRAKQ